MTEHELMILRLRTYVFFNSKEFKADALLVDGATKKKIQANDLAVELLALIVKYERLVQE